jgi:decaprenylphospho-beta-D-erythro-pentofuranosid-2-ulose 2-reductase
MRDAVGSVQSVLVLGGGSEIGLATARALVRRRARTVVLAGRDPERFRDGAESLRRDGAATVETVPFDARDTDAHPAFVRDVFDRFGDIDLVLFAFGVLGDQEAAEKDIAHALEIVETNYVGAASMALLLAQRMRAQGHGTIVVLSSVAAERARRANFVYGSSKAGIDALSQGLGDALVGTGVDVVVVRPGFVRTKMTAHMDDKPMTVTPEEVAAAIVRGLETGAETVWVPAKLRWVMSAVRHLPRRVFRRLKV